MPAVFYLIIATLMGRSLRRFFLSEHKLLSAAPPYVKVTADFLLGLIPLTTANYFFALLVNSLFKNAIYPLAVSNIISLSLAIGVIFLETMHSHRRQSIIEQSYRLFGRLKSNTIEWSYKTIFYTVSILIFCAWAWLLTAHVLRSESGFLGAGFSVFSDYAPHTAVISSFSRGANFPTEYPHFAGDGIQYHFFFYFLAGNLQYLGLGLAAALNVPSALGIVSFSLLLGYIAVLWTKRDAAFLLAPMLVFFRSSNAIWHWLREVPGLAAEAGVSVLSYIRDNEIFIGRQPMDDWGLWNLNVFANQRHLLFVLAAALLLLIIYYPSLQKPGLRTWITREGWMSHAWKSYLPAFMLMACLPYWHGSVTVALLLMMAYLAIFSHEKAVYLVSAIIALGFAFLYARSFSGRTGGSISPAFQWGFISENKSFFAVMGYLWELLGLALPALLILPFLQSTATKRILASAIIFPLVFALTISLTPDITVNHKYIMISQMLATVLTGDLILRFRRLKSKRVPAFIGPAIAVILAIFLGATGIIDLIVYRNKNKNLFYIPETTAFQTWIENETDRSDIFLTPPWHYHPFFLTGRKAWYGHSYYAWSAGHDTTTREAEVRSLWQGSENDPNLFVDYCMQNGIQYAIITDDLRTSADFALNEAFFAEHFETVAMFPEQNNAIIYRIYE